MASANLAGLGTKAAGRARLVQGSWWHALPGGLKGTVDLAVTNPPYVAENELAALPPEVSGGSRSRPWWPGRAGSRR